MSREKITRNRVKTVIQIGAEKEEMAEFFITQALHRCEQLGVAVVACPDAAHCSPAVQRIILHPTKLMFRHPDVRH